MPKPDGVMVAEDPKLEVVTPDKPTLADVAETLMPAEIEMGVEQGEVIDPDKKPEEKKPAAKKEQDLSVRLEVSEAFDDPEKEAALLEGYNKNEKGLYHKMKAATRKRQAAESERDHTRLKLKAEAEKSARLEKELELARTKPGEKAPPAKAEPKLDIFGNPIEAEIVVDDKEKPLTRKDIEEIEAEKAKKKEKEDADEKEKTERAQRIVGILNDQQAEAQVRYEGFDKELELAVEIMQAGDKLEDMFPNKRDQGKARKLIVDFVYASRNADKLSNEDYNATDIAHEMAQMHPKYGKTDGGSATPQVNGAIDTKKAEKILENAGKRGSSASLASGGAKKFVPYEEMTVEQLAALSDSEFRKVPKQVQEKFLRET